MYRVTIQNILYTPVLLDRQKQKCLPKTQNLSENIRDLCFWGKLEITGILLVAVRQRDTGIRFLFYQGGVELGKRTEAVCLQGGAFRM